MGEITCSSLLAKYLLSTSKAILSARQANYQICLIWKRQKHLQTACEIAHQETGSLTTKENVSQRDSESLTLVHWYVPLCPIGFVKTRFAA